MQVEHGIGPQKSDLVAVLLSFLAGIVQLLLFIIGTLGQIVGLQKLFFNPEIVPFSIILSLTTALCLVGIISFIRKNPDYILQETSFKLLIWLRKKFFDGTIHLLPLSKAKVKRTLIVTGLLLLFFSFIFVISTLIHINPGVHFLVFIDQETASLYQILSFMALWVTTPAILYVWISNEIEKGLQYKPDDFIPNLIRSFQNQGFIQIVINNDVQLQDGFHLVSARIQKEEKFFIVQFDGRRVVRELSKNDFDNFFLKQKVNQWLLSLSSKNPNSMVRQAHHEMFRWTHHRDVKEKFSLNGCLFNHS